MEHKINNTPILKFLSELPTNKDRLSEVGICYNLTCIGDATTEEMGQFINLCKTWADYSGNIYPIPSLKNRVLVEDYYFTVDNLWASKQLEQRVSLINHVIKHWES